MLKSRLRPSLVDALPRFAERGLLTLVLIAVTTLVLSPLRGDLNTPIIALLYLIPVGLGARLGGPGAPARASLLPAGVQRPSASPVAVLPLMTARGRFGEIRLWRREAELLPAEQQLLATFAGQGALALEHAQLSQAETQARILE